MFSLIYTVIIINLFIFLNFFQVHRGVSGFIRNIEGDPIPGVSIKVRDNDHVTKSAENGDYWRILTPGRYTLNFSKEGYSLIFRN